MCNIAEGKIKNILSDKKLDAIIVSNPYNIRYFSGFSGGTGCLYISKTKKSILTDFRYRIQAENESNGYEVIEVTGPYSKFLNELVKEETIETIGFEGGDVLYNQYADWKKKIEVKQWIPLKDELSDLRSVKTKEELECIQRAEEIGDIAFQKILNVIKPGLREIEIAAYLEFYMKQEGAEALSFDTIVASGIHSSMPHAVPTNKKIQSGDFVTMDFGCRYQGYCSDMTRTIVVGKASNKQKQIYQIVKTAQQEALNFICAGYKGKEIDKVARDIIYKEGYKECFGHGLGHSVGLFIHENPRLSPNEDAIILENVVETVEPGIYIPQFGGVRIEDLVVVTKSGCVNYTKSEKNLIEL